MICKPLLHQLMFSECSWFAWDSFVWASPLCGAGFAPPCRDHCVLSQVGMAIMSVLLGNFIHFRVIGDRADNLGSGDPLAIGPSSALLEQGIACHSCLCVSYAFVKGLMIASCRWLTGGLGVVALGHRKFLLLSCHALAASGYTGPCRGPWRVTGWE